MPNLRQKEQLCESPLDWPGVHCARALVRGEKLEGFWYNRSKEWAARAGNPVAGVEKILSRKLVMPGT